MRVHSVNLRKPDGRALLLYARAPLPAGLEAPTPGGERARPASHLRWHPMRGEWVVYATHRQDRTFLPPPEWNPLAPTVPGGEPTEVPSGPWEVAVFENRFPALSASPGDPPPSIVDTRPGTGACEVVVFGQDPKASLGGMPLEQVRLVIEVWAERTTALGAREDVRYVFPFENRGVEVGVTLHHPHGQIYGYPFVPPNAKRELDEQAAFFRKEKRGLLDDLIRREREDGTRMLYAGPHAVAFMPAFARYSYEVWIAPSRAVPRLDGLSSDERDDFARALKTVLMKYDALWNRPFPYLMVMHQGPTDGEEHPEAHVHLEIYPAFRMPGRLKYLAGSEMGAGVFTADTLPESKVAELKAVEVRIE